MRFQYPVVVRQQTAVTGKGRKSTGTGGVGRRSVTMSDVANRAGVSMTTVSRVFSQDGGDGLVNALTRRRVLRAADQLGYRAHWAARALARQRSGLIGALVPELGGGFVAGVTDGVMRESQQAGYEPILAHCGPSPSDIGRALDYLLQMRVEGIVFRPRMSLPIEDGLLAGEPQEVPVVLVDLSVAGLSLPLVTSDDAGGIRQAVDHLVSLGHERIGHLAGPFWASSGVIRLRAFRESMASHGLQVPVECIAHYDWQFAHAVDSSQRLLQAQPRPTALIAASVPGAAAVLQVARQMGLRVPDDLAVIGFTDTMLCDSWSPALTTVRQPREELGQEAVRLLLRLIGGEKLDPGYVHLLPTELIVRDSGGRRANNATAPGAADTSGIGGLRGLPLTETEA